MIRTTFDVFCDADGCNAWTFGCVERVRGWREARRNAAAHGWVHRKDIDGAYRDLCPAHASTPAAAGSPETDQ